MLTLYVSAYFTIGKGIALGI